jgi:FkbM family methyltransferase
MRKTAHLEPSGSADRQNDRSRTRSETAVSAPVRTTPEFGSRLLPPKARLARWLGRNVTLRGLDRLLRVLQPPGESVGGTTVIESWNGLQYLVDTESFLEWRLFIYGEYEIDLQVKMEQCLREGDIAIDCGANVGIHTCSLARRVGPSGRVIAVEPMHELADRMEANCRLNGLSNVTGLRLAVSSAPGEGILFCPSPDSPNQGQASLFREALDSSVPRSISITTVDEIVASNRLPAVRLIKIDTQGNELEILRGAVRTLAVIQPMLFFEYDHETYEAAEVEWSELVHLLTDRLGYRLYGLTEHGGEHPLGRDRPNRSATVIARSINQA